MKTEPRVENAYLKYSSIAFQLAAMITISILVGKKIDEYFGLEKPIVTMVLVVIFFALFMYKLYSDLTSNHK